MLLFIIEVIIKHYIIVYYFFWSLFIFIFLSVNILWLIHYWWFFQNVSKILFVIFIIFINLLVQILLDFNLIADLLFITILLYCIESVLLTISVKRLGILRNSQGPSGCSWTIINIIHIIFFSVVDFTYLANLYATVSVYTWYLTLLFNVFWILSVFIQSEISILLMLITMILLLVQIFLSV